MALFAVLFPRDVHAYLDPGAGSLVFQTVIATAVTVAYGIRIYWSKLKSALARRAPNSSAAADPPAPTGDR